jgi:hypothetical protein
LTPERRAISSFASCGEFVNLVLAQRRDENTGHMPGELLPFAALQRRVQLVPARLRLRAREPRRDAKHRDRIGALKDFLQTLQILSRRRAGVEVKTEIRRLCRERAPHQRGCHGPASVEHAELASGGGEDLPGAVLQMIFPGLRDLLTEERIDQLRAAAGAIAHQ